MTCGPPPAGDPASSTLDGERPWTHTSGMGRPFSAPGQWVPDVRGDGRGVRVSAHAEGGFLVVSTWKSGACVGTVRLLPDEAADLVAALSQGLASLAQGVAQPESAPSIRDV